VPVEACDYLISKYGCDVMLKRKYNPECESWRTDLKDRYILKHENVPLLIMVQNKIPKTKIEDVTKEEK